MNILERVGGQARRAPGPEPAVEQLERMPAQLEQEPDDRRALAVSRLQQEVGSRVELDWVQSDGVTWTMRGTNMGVRIGRQTGRTLLVVRLRQDRLAYVLGKDKDQPCHDYLIDINTVSRVAGGLPPDEDAVEPEPGPKQQ